MKIGLSVPLAHETPQQWAKKHRELGCIVPVSGDVKLPRKPLMLIGRLRNRKG